MERSRSSEPARGPATPRLGLIAAMGGVLMATVFFTLPPPAATPAPESGAAPVWSW